MPPISDEHMRWARELAAKFPAHAKLSSERAARVLKTLDEARNLHKILKAASTAQWTAHVTQHPPSPDQIAALLVVHEAHARQQAQARAARAKSKDAANWARTEFAKRPNKSQSASDWAAKNWQRINKQFRKNLSGPRQVSEVYLKGVPRK